MDSRVSPLSVVAGGRVEEAAIRRDLAACYRLIAHFGWDDLIATHISASLPGEDAFLINPFGMLFEEVTASSLVKINAAGEILEPTPYGVNQAGFVVHSAVHMARPDAGCVIHLHTRDGVAVSMLDCGLLPYQQSAMVIASDIAVHEYEGIADDLDERERLAADLGTKNMMLLRNHGTLALGRTVAEAFSRIHVLETCCTIQIKAMSAGRELHVPDPQVIAAMAERMGPDAFRAFSDDLVWPAMLRKLDRIDPGYKA